MNKKVLLLTASLLALAMLVTPVISVSPKKIPVTRVTVPFVISTPPDIRWTGNAMHSRGEVRERSFYMISGDGMPTLTGYTYFVSDFNFVKKGEVAPGIDWGTGTYRWNMTIYFDDGTFNGYLINKGVYLLGVAPFPWLWDGTRHAVLQGTGDYQGWTYKFTGGKIDGDPIPMEHYMLIP